MYKHQLLNKRIIGLMLIILVISMPFSIAQNGKKEIGKEESDGFLSATIEKDFLEGQTTEVNIIVNRYEPTVLTTNILEEQNVPVFAFLSATPTSSTSLPRIQRVTITEVKGNRSSTAGVRYYEPKVWSWQDIGYIELRLKKIEKEHKVPEKISVDLKARIEYEADVTSNLIGGAQTKILKETPLTSLQEVITDPSADIFGGKGHIVLTQVGTNSANFRIYDSEGKFINQVPSYLGRDSAPVSLVPGSNLPENQVRVRLNKIIDETENSANIIIDKLNHTLIKGTRILDWKTENIIVKEKTKYISLIKEGTGEKVILAEGSTQDKTSKDINIIDAAKNVNDQNYLTLKRDWENYRVEAIKEGKKPRAVFRVGGQRETKEITLGNKITEKGPSECDYLNENEKPPKNICKLESIQTGRVIVSHPDIDLTIKDEKNRCKIVQKTLSLRNLDRRYLSEEIVLPISDSLTDTLSASFCGDSIVLDSIETSKSVEATLLSGFTKGITETVFNLNIPIEKRAIRLSPRGLDDKINSTQELIERLTKTIDKLEKVVESWTKICLATTAIFTIWNFIFADTKEDEFVKPKLDDVLKESEIDTDKTIVGKFCKLSAGYEALKNYKDAKENQIFIKKDDKGGGALNLYYIEKDNECHALTNSVIYDEKGIEYRYNPSSKIIEPIKKISFSNGNIQTFVDADGTNVAVIPIKSDSQLYAISTIIGRQYNNEWKSSHGSAANHYYLVYYENKKVEVKLAVTGEISIDNDPSIGPAYIKGTDSQNAYLEVERSVIRQIGTAQKRGDSNVRLFGDEYKLDTPKKLRPGSIKCEEVLGPTQCQLMYNACDPVMCPASRCNLAGDYEVPDDNVIQSGLIGSLILCAPNFGEVAVPFCLSGILASLKNIRSHLEAYKQCLITAKVDDKAVGVCDKIRSIFMCEIVWKEALTLLNARGGILNFIFKKAGGGGSVSDTLGIKGRVERLKKTVDFFTGSYATTIFAAYRGKTTEQLGAEVCRSAIGGAFPNLGEFVNEISQPEDPPQFTAYFEEHEYSQTLGNSRYNIFYHVYAGKPRPASPQILNYFVFLKKQGLQDITIARGSLKAGDFADESKDILGPRGYQEICISLNGKVQCGFGKIVSTSFGINQLANKYFAEDLAGKITKAEECVPSQKSALNSASAGFLPTAAVERVCSLSNPYLGLTKQKENEWYIIGECNTAKGSLGKCWEHANLERYPEIQSQVYKDSCEENQNAKLCHIYERCTNGVVVGEFNFEKDVPLLTRKIQGSLGELGVRKCCADGGTCEAFYPLLDDEIEKSIRSFEDKGKIDLIRRLKSVAELKEGGFTEKDFGDTHKVLAEGEVLDKNKYNYFLALLILKYNDDYSGALTPLRDISEKEGKELIKKLTSVLMTNQINRKIISDKPINTETKKDDVTGELNKAIEKRDAFAKQIDETKEFEKIADLLEQFNKELEDLIKNSGIKISDSSGTKPPQEQIIVTNIKKSQLNELKKDDLNSKIIFSHNNFGKITITRYNDTSWRIEGEKKEQLFLVSDDINAVINKLKILGLSVDENS